MSFEKSKTTYLGVMLFSSVVDPFAAVEGLLSDGDFDRDGF